MNFMCSFRNAATLRTLSGVSSWSSMPRNPSRPKTGNDWSAASMKIQPPTRERWGRVLKLGPICQVSVSLSFNWPLPLMPDPSLPRPYAQYPLALARATIPLCLSLTRTSAAPRISGFGRQWRRDDRQHSRAVSWFRRTSLAWSTPGWTTPARGRRNLLARLREVGYEGDWAKALLG